MTRMRTVSQAYEMIHTDDPGSQISKMWLYQQIRAGTLPYIAAGKRFLLDYDRLPDFIERLSAEQMSSNCSPNNIRRIGTR